MRKVIVRMAERSKALRSGRSPLLWAWVRIPLLTISFVGIHRRAMRLSCEYRNNPNFGFNPLRFLGLINKLHGVVNVFAVL